MTTEAYSAIHHHPVRPVTDDTGLCSKDICLVERELNAEIVIQRFFVGKFKAGEVSLAREAMIRSINAGPAFEMELDSNDWDIDDEFGPQLLPPSSEVEDAFRAYSHTELGAVALARLVEWDNLYIAKGWREPGGALTEAGVRAFGEGKWRPFRVASNGEGPDTVTPSGVLVLPDFFRQETYSTGDIAHPLAILHHEIKAHVLPLKAAEGLVPGREMELICVRLESEMLDELGLPKRRLNWGKDDGFNDHTLNEADEKYYYGLVRYDKYNNLLEIDPDTETVIGPAKFKL